MSSTAPTETAHEEWRADDDTVTVKRGNDTVVIAYATTDIYTTKAQAKARAKRIASDHNMRPQLLDALAQALIDAEAYLVLAPGRYHAAIRKRCDSYRSTIAMAEGR